MPVKMSPQRAAAIRKYYATKKAAAKPARSTTTKAKPKSGDTARYYGKMIGRSLGALSAPLIAEYAPAISPLAPAIGEAIGGLGGTLFNKVTGMGNYVIQRNTLLYPDQTVPSFGEDSIRIRKREFITLLDASTTFENYSFPINPGISASFPWLSGIASNYEQYRFNGLIFQLISSSGDTTSTSALGLGSIAMSTDYDAADPPHQTMVQALGNTFSNTCKPSENCLHAVECAPGQQAQKLYYIRAAANPVNTDIRLYDLGLFQVCVDRCPANYTGMSQLWVSYDVTLTKSTSGSQQGVNIPTDHYYMTNMSAVNPFGTARALKPNSTLGLVVSPTSITFPSWIGNGAFMFVWRSYGNPTTITTPTITYTNCTVQQCFLGDTITHISDSGAATEDSLIMIVIVKVTSSGAVMSLSGGTFPTSTNNGDLVVTQLNGNIYN